MKLPVGQIKGLYTNVDSNDISSEYVQKAQDVRFRNGYAISEGFNLQSIPKPEGQILWLESIELDEDRLKTKVVDGEIVFDYSQRLFTTYLLIVKSDKVHFYLYQIGADSWREIIPQFELPEELEIRTVVNRYGTVRIYTDQETLWLGKISRHWKQLNGITSIFNDYYLDRLIEPFDRTNLGVVIRTGLQGGIFCAEGRRLGILASVNVVDDPDLILEKPKGRFLEVSRSNTAYGGHPGIKMKLVSNDGEELPNPTQGTGFTAGPLYTEWLPDENTIGFADQLPIPIVKPATDISQYPSSTDPFGNHVRLIPLSDFFQIEFEYLRGNKISDFGFENIYKEYEIVITATIDGTDEYVIAYQKNTIVSAKPRIAFEVLAGIPKDINKRITALSFYLRFRDTDDFEQVRILNLFDKDAEYQFYISSLSPNGTFLVQTIGTSFDIKTFKVISVPDDSKVIDGISYIIKDRAVYHSAVGGGKILENTYYPENIIPSVEGTFLIDVNTYPAVADLLNTRITLLSVVADEGIFLFATKDTYSYELKDRFDVVEMPEGCIFNTRQGIILSNGESVDFISEPINDICEREFDNSSIYFDRIRGEIFLSTQNGVFRYWTLSQSWNQISHLEGYRLRFSLSGDKSIGYTPETLSELTYGAKRGIVVLHPVSFNELRIAKVLNSVTFDFEGTLKFNGKEVNLQQRGESIFKMKLFQRIPVIKFKPEFEFEGTFYGMELNYEVAGELIK